MRVLVTGGAGYVGSHTVAALHGRGDDVLVLDSLERGHRQAVGPVPLVQGDVANARLVARLLRRQRTEAIVHFAAHKQVDESLRDPGRYFTNNVASSLSLIAAAAEAGVQRFVFSSSCAVYGTPARLPVDEHCPLAPENPYGASKAMVEQILAWYGRAGQMRSVSLRYFNAAGAAADGSNGEDWAAATNLVPIVMRAAAGRLREVTVFGTDYPTPDGTAIRDYVHVEDLARGHLAALDYLEAGEASQIVNLGTGTGASVREVITSAESVTGRRIQARYAGRRPGDPAAIWADPSQAQRLFGWKAERDLTAILASAWRWHQGHPDGHQDADPAAERHANTSAPPARGKPSQRVRP